MTNLIPPLIQYKIPVDPDTHTVVGENTEGIGFAVAGFDITCPADGERIPAHCRIVERKTIVEPDLLIDSLEPLVGEIRIVVILPQ